jgi:thiosulfate dehydrogenase
MNGKIFIVFLIFISCGCLERDVNLDHTPSKILHERASIDRLEPHLKEAVLKGREVMEDENLGTNGLSCASCHPNPNLNKVWANLFPRRWASTMNPNHRIITLAQHNYGAYTGMMGGDLKPEDPVFNYLNTYLMWLGDGTKIWEEETPGQFQLEESILRGKKLFHDKDFAVNSKSCSSCHSEKSLEGVASLFPKYSETYEEVFILDNFIKSHSNDTQGTEIDLMSQEIADLSSFLTNLSRDYVIFLERD